MNWRFLIKPSLSLADVFMIVLIGPLITTVIYFTRWPLLLADLAALGLWLVMAVPWIRWERRHVPGAWGGKFDQPHRGRCGVRRYLGRGWSKGRPHHG